MMRTKTRTQPGNLANGAAPSAEATTPDQTPNFGGLISKTDKFAWTTGDQPGEFRQIAKDLLRVDPSYQRTDGVSETKVLAIARRWYWIGAHTLIVAERPDGSLWIVDGQHRWLAALKRADISELPCMVFRVAAEGEEAAGFLRSNTFRHAMSVFHKFRAQVAAHDAAAVAVSQMIAESGYEYTRKGGGKPRTVSCLSTLVAAYRRHPDATRVAWNLCLKVAQGAAVHHKIFNGLAFLEHYLSRRNLGSLLLKQNEDALVRAGPDKLLQKMEAAVVLKGKGGPRIYAQGLVEVLNHRRMSGRLPDIVRDGKEE
jgi:hypothetical protein